MSELQVRHIASMLKKKLFRQNRCIRLFNNEN